MCPQRETYDENVNVSPFTSSLLPAELEPDVEIDVLERNQGRFDFCDGWTEAFTLARA